MPILPDVQLPMQNWSDSGSEINVNKSTCTTYRWEILDALSHRIAMHKCAFDMCSCTITEPRLNAEIEANDKKEQRSCSPSLNPSLLLFKTYG